MTEETKDAEREAEVQGNEETEIDWKAVNSGVMAMLSPHNGLVRSMHGIGHPTPSTI